MTFRVTESDKEKALAYYSAIATDYEGHVSRSRLLTFFRTRERDAIQKLLALEQAPETLIDVGCGNGTWALFAKAKGLRVKGVDASEKMLERLRARIDEVEVIDLDSWVPDKQYDRVVCAGVLDFVLSPERAFATLCRLVKPGGRLVILVPRTGIFGLYYRFEKALIRVRVNLFSRNWLKTQAERNGLRWVDAIVPLPTNIAVGFELPGSPKRS